jgi:hypothetical protein
MRRLARMNPTPSDSWPNSSRTARPAAARTAAASWSGFTDGNGTMAAADSANMTATMM